VKHLDLGGILILVLLAAGIGRGADKERPQQTPQPSAEYTKQRDLVLPNPRERSYRKIGWRTSVLRGIVDAQQLDRPVMIALMNGHPLGCT
jgi:hypothetical protein